MSRNGTQGRCSRFAHLSLLSTLHLKPETRNAFLSIKGKGELGLSCVPRAREWDSGTANERALDTNRASPRRHLSELTDRIAKGLEDVKKSVRAADELP